MNETLYAAAFVLPMTAAPIIDGAIHVRDGRIIAVGTRATLCSATPLVELVDFGAAILMPPLVNAHTHLELTDFKKWRSAATTESIPPEDFAEWILQVIRIKRERSHDDFCTSLKNGLRESLASGVGVIVDILSLPELADCYDGTPLLGRIDLELIGRDPKFVQPLLKRAEKWLAGRTPDGFDRGLSPHAPYTVSAEILSEIVNFAEARRVAFSIHTAESAAEVQLLQQSQGVLAEKLYPAVSWLPPDPPLQITPVDYLHRSGAMRSSTLLIHAVHLTPDEIGRIGRTGSTVVLCPRSNEQLGTGVAPVEQFICRGVRLALGTDSLASNDSLSIWAEMEAAQRIYAGLLSPAQIVAMATINGADAIGLAGEIGALQPGSGAHFLVLQPETLPAACDLAAFLCQSDRQQQITHHFLHGIDLLFEA
ncbi:MAG: amidohydrolase family protein [Desulfuromonadales bacterium]|nr:amidohydrolase family protein [Desulfuromonadales bacterium]